MKPYSLEPLVVLCIGSKLSFLDFHPRLRNIKWAKEGRSSEKEVRTMPTTTKVVLQLSVVGEGKGAGREE